jgi:hypothetical protein
MRSRVVASFLLALAGAAVLYLSLQARTADIRRQALQRAALVGSPATSPRTPADAYLAALAAFRADRKHRTAEAGPRAATIADVQQAIRKALDAGQPRARRSQLENLAGALEVELAGLGGDQASAHERAAAHWLQRSALDDDTNADAKFNLQLLISQDPKSAQKQPQPAGGQSEGGSPEGKRDVKNRSRKAGRLGEGF